VTNEINAAWAKGRAKRAKGLHGVHNEIVRALNAQKRKRAADAAGTPNHQPASQPGQRERASTGKGLAHLAAGRTRRQSRDGGLSRDIGRRSVPSVPTRVFRLGTESGDRKMAEHCGFRGSVPSVPGVPTQIE